MSTAVRIHQISKKFLDPIGPLEKRTGKQNLRLTGRSLVQAASIVALDRISLTVEEGEIFGLVGPGGSGKSTLLRLLAGLLQPDEGELQIFGIDAVRYPAQVRPWLNPLAMGASFFGKLSPVENLLPGTSQGAQGSNAAIQQVSSILSRLGLDGRTMHLPMETLDRSLQPLVRFARALYPIPRLLLLDEPMDGLESSAWMNVQALLNEWRDQYGVTVLITAPCQDLLITLCDRVALLEAGKLAALESPGVTPCQVQEFRRSYMFLSGKRQAARGLETV